MIFNRGFVAVVAMTLSACATHARPVSSILIRRGEPTVSYGAPEKGSVKEESKRARSPKAAVDPSVDRSPRVLQDSGTTVEGTDKALGEALKTLRRRAPRRTTWRWRPSTGACEFSTRLSTRPRWP